MLYSRAAFQRGIKCLTLVVAMLALNTIPARAVVLEVTLLDVMVSTLGSEFPLIGWFIYDPVREEILDASFITAEGDIPGQFIPLRLANMEMETSLRDSSMLWPSFAFLSIYVFPTFIDPPADGCQWYSLMGLQNARGEALCLTPLEPITKPGQLVELSGDGIFTSSDAFFITRGWLHTRAAGQSIPEPPLISLIFLVIYGVVVYRIRRHWMHAQGMPVA